MKSLPLIYWDIYEVTSRTASLNGIMLRGRIRKLCLEKDKSVLVENTEDIENGVRFAVPTGETVSAISKYLNKIISDVKIEKVLSKVANPVLSKLKVNDEKRYSL